MPVKLVYRQTAGHADNPEEKIVIFPRDKTIETMKYLHNAQGLTVMGTGKTECVGPVTEWRLSVCSEEDSEDDGKKDSGVLPVDHHDLLVLRMALDSFGVSSDSPELIKESHRALLRKVERLTIIVRK